MYPDSYIHIHVYVRDKITVRQLELRGRRAASGVATRKDLVHENMPRPRIPSLVHQFGKYSRMYNFINEYRWLSMIDVNMQKKKKNMYALLKLGSKFDISVTTATVFEYHCICYDICILII